MGGGREAVPGIERAASMGLHVVVSDGDPRAPGFSAATDHILADTYDAGATLAAAEHYHRTVRRLDGTVCLAADVPVTVATVADALGLPGISLDSARLSADKLAMKQALVAAGVAVPWFAPVSSSARLRALAGERGFPLVLKPVDSRGARGVLRLTDGVDLDWAFHVARAASPTGRVMVEEFLAGPQVSTESIVLDGVAHTPGFSDRNYELLARFAPYVIENGGELPSVLPGEDQDAVRAVVGRAAAAMGVRWGVVKGDIVLRRGRPHVIEVATRMSGGYFCTHEIPLNTGVDFVGVAIRLAVGEPVDPADLVPRFQRGVAQRYLFPQPGRVVRIHGVEDVARRSEVALCDIRVEVGSTVRPVDSHPARAGVVIASGGSRAAAVASAAAAAQAIRIETEPAS